MQLYVANGYDGVFVTEHFMSNGCCKADLSQPYEKQVDDFFRGYERVKEAANGQIKVFFGFEHSYKGTDVLVYGWGKEELKKHPEIMNMSMREFIEFVNSHGGVTVQAHPFREDYYIDHIRLFPECQGVEVFNSSRNELCNDLGLYYAKGYQKIQTGGSDLHRKEQPILSGMEFDFEISSESDFVNALKNRQGRIIKQKNVLIEE